MNRKVSTANSDPEGTTGGGQLLSARNMHDSHPLQPPLSIVVTMIIGQTTFVGGFYLGRAPLVREMGEPNEHS